MRIYGRSQLPTLLVGSRCFALRRCPLLPKDTTRLSCARAWCPDAAYYDEATKLQTGTVKWFNAAKGYGFIQPDGGGADAFVHVSAVERAGLDGLNEGQRVQFDIVRARTARVRPRT